MSTQSGSGKDVIYIDIDDEITAIIDKLRGSHEKIVALVLPKRATMLQSIVNMKLLKRTADEAKKHLVLITSEAGLLPLAGSVGLYVAKTLQSKPEVPSAPAHSADGNDDEEDAVNMADEAEELDAAAPVGEHMKKGKNSAVAVAPVAPADDVDEDLPIELDNTAAAGPEAPSGKKSKSKKKFSIPNFDKFRLWLIIGGVALVVFVVMWYMAFVSLPRADILIKTDSTALQSSLDVTLDTEADTANVDDGVIPAESQSTVKSFTQQADATGQKDNGTKATGSVRFYNCNLDDLILGTNRTVPAGTGVVANGLTFITQQSVTVEPSNFSNGSSNCKNNKPSSPVEIVAQTAGEKYNIAAANYTVANSSTITGQGTATSGGTSQIVKILTQTDIDGAKQKIAAQDPAAVKQELKQGLASKGWFVIEATFRAAEPEVTTSAKVGDEVATVTVTEKITYSMLGTKETDLKKVIANDVKDKIDESKQSILDYDLAGASYKPQNQQETSALVSVDATPVVGTDLDLNDIKKQVAGKKSGNAKQIIGEYPGVTSVDVKYRPFWVSSIPKNTGKINVTVEKPVIKSSNDR